MKKKKQLTIGILALVVLAAALILLTTLNPDFFTFIQRNDTTADKQVNTDWDYYARPDDTLRLTAYSGNDSELVIPESINGKTVTKIDDGVFSDSNTFTSVTIPATINALTYESFAGANIQEIIVDEENNYYASEDGVLFNKQKTKLLYYPTQKEGSYELPETVELIEASAFSGCQFLTDITFPASLEHVEFSAFSGCSSLSFINISEANTMYASIDGIVYNKDKSTVEYCPEGKSGAVVIPDGVSTINYSAFYECTQITSVQLPDSVNHIYDAAFACCTSLASINLPDGLLCIDSGAFSCCNALDNIVIPSGITALTECIFEYCINLKNIQIPDTVTVIESCAFDNCTSLSEIELSDSITNIAGSAFNNCTSLEEFKVSDNNTAYSVSDGILYSKDKTTLVKCPISKSGTFEVPDGVTSIGAYACYCCEFTDVVLPDSITYIGDCAFAQCPELSSIVLPSGINGIEYSTFESVSGLTIYCETGSYANDYAKQHNIYSKELAD